MNLHVDSMVEKWMDMHVNSGEITFGNDLEKTPPEMPTMPQAKNSKRKLLNTKHPKPKFPKQGSQAKTPTGRIPDERSQTKDRKRKLASEEPHFKVPK